MTYSNLILANKIQFKLLYWKRPKLNCNGNDSLALYSLRKCNVIHKLSSTGTTKVKSGNFTSVLHESFSGLVWKSPSTQERRSGNEDCCIRKCQIYVYQIKDMLSGYTSTTVKT